MKVYVQFLTKALDGKEIIDLLGSEGVFILDGRNSLATWKADATERAYRMRKVHPTIVGWKIIVNDRFTDDPDKVVYEETK
jgi:hypothetical protein